MTEPLKPRIDFDGPLEVDQNPKFRAQQTFDENQAQNFAPATLDEAQEEEGQVEAVMDAALRPKRSLWRKMVMGGLALFGASVVGQGAVDNERLANPGLGGAGWMCRWGIDYRRWRRFCGNRVAALMALATARP